MGRSLEGVHGLPGTSVSGRFPRVYTKDRQDECKTKTKQRGSLNRALIMLDVWPSILLRRDGNGDGGGGGGEAWKDVD